MQRRRAALRAGASGLLAVTAAAGLGGCAGWFEPPETAALRRARASAGGADDEEAASARHLPPRAERADAPFLPQSPYHCGPAALATALADVGLPADPVALGDAVFLPSRGGSLQWEMLAGARRQGGVAALLPARLDALLTEVAAGHVAVVLLNLGLAIAPRWHYAVLVGYDLDDGARGQVLLRSGTARREAMPLATFEHTWARGGRWAFVVLPPGRLPQTVTEQAALEGAIGFERVAPAAQAASAYRAVLSRWPGSLVAAIGLGNTLRAAGDAGGAAAVLEAAARRHDHAMAWHNLARVRLDLADADGALAAATRALQRAQAAPGEARWLEHARAALADAVAAAGPGARR